jgi:hypothetical protein
MFKKTQVNAHRILELENDDAWRVVGGRSTVESNPLNDLE